MPAGVGYSPGSLGALAAQARAAMGQLPQPGAVPQPSLESMLSALQGNPQMMLQLLALLAGAGGGEMMPMMQGGPQQGAAPGGDIEAAMMEAAGGGY